jgi:hypothetical protein
MKLMPQEGVPRLILPKRERVRQVNTKIVVLLLMQAYAFGERTVFVLELCNSARPAFKYN